MNLRCDLLLINPKPFVQETHFISSITLWQAQEQAWAEQMNVCVRFQIPYCISWCWNPESVGVRWQTYCWDTMREAKEGMVWLHQNGLLHLRLTMEVYMISMVSLWLLGYWSFLSYFGTFELSNRADIFKFFFCNCMHVRGSCKDACKVFVRAMWRRRFSPMQIMKNRHRF